MKTKVLVKVKIPVYAYNILQLIKKQNKALDFELDKKTGELCLSCDLYDFPDYADDGEWDEINDFMEGVE